MFRFPEAGEHEDGDMFGAIIEELDEQPDGRLRAHLLFWSELARIYVTPGASFEVWYASTVGDGVVLSARSSAGSAGDGAGFGFDDGGVDDVGDGGAFFVVCWLGPARRASRWLLGALSGRGSALSMRR